MVRVARLYHEVGRRQADIASDLHISQARVSRLLKRAAELGIVRTTVTVPGGVHADLEEALEERFGLGEAVVVDALGGEHDVARALGDAAAGYLESTLMGGERVGISSWSGNLLATVEAMRPSQTQVAEQVVQLLGGTGVPGVQLQANRLITLFAAATGAMPVLLPGPSLLGTVEARRALARDPAVEQVSRLWGALTTALVGVGTLKPSELLEQSGSGVSEADQAVLRAAGAVGDVCLRFFDAAGSLVESAVDQRVLGISPSQLKAIPRRIGVAGGARKVSALRGALLGGWVNVLITDSDAAEQLLA
jgi:DNA-binding transcriptional regulator LsrR (DeoR family)